MTLGESRTWLALAAFLLFGWLLYILSPILTPFLIAALLAYLFDPLVDRMERLRVPRAVGVLVVFAVFSLLLVAVVIVLVPLVGKQINALADAMPGYLDWINTNLIPWLERRLDIDIYAIDLAALKDTLSSNFRTAGSAAANILSYITQSGVVLLGWMVNLLLIPMVVFYLLRDWDRILVAIGALMPRHIEPTVSRLARESNEVLGAFLRGQLLVMTALGIIYSIGLWLIGLDFALLIGMIAGLVSFVPYLGVIVGLVLASLAMMFQTGNVLDLVWVALVFSAGQSLEGMVLTPWLVGDRIGIHPVMVIFAVLAGGQLFGFFGVLLALPVASVLAVLARFARERYIKSDLYESEDAE